MINLALIPLEKAINRAIATDPETQKRLNTLADKVIKLEITDWNLSLFIMPHLNRIELQSRYKKSPNTTLRGRLNDLVNIGLAKDKQTALKKHKIEFQGEADVGMTLQRVLSELDIDWEAYLSSIIGETPGHLVSNFLKKASSTGKQILESLTQSTKEYLLYEKRVFPTQAELTAFYEDVAIIRNDVERLAARIQQLKQKRSTS